MYLHVPGLSRQTLEGIGTEKTVENVVSIHLQCIITRTCLSYNLVYPPHSVTRVDGVQIPPQGHQGTPEQNNSN